MSEFDSSAPVFKSGAQELAALMAAGAEHGRLWRSNELAAVFRHQMSTPMLVDLGTLEAGAAARLRTLSDAQGLLLKSFGDLFHHPAPPVELLELVKNFAKSNMDQPESGLPHEIAAALYYSSIAAALVHLETRISQLPDAELGRGLSWAREQAWLDDRTRGLLARAQEKLSGGKEPSRA